ncbi:hypothetical protein PG993_012450 [Apiospora rasikravindrae]|uniref:Uncharacterized protein n=1 Tax=Apiospora rasikravindrae TaxID=990691 RepID=A0ABR1S2H0_9PEZI
MGESSLMGVPISSVGASGVPQNGRGLSAEAKIGLGVGVEVGIPLFVLMGLGCFLLWRLWGRQKGSQGQGQVQTVDSGK